VAIMPANIILDFIVFPSTVGVPPRAKRARHEARPFQISLVQPLPLGNDRRWGLTLTDLCAARDA
jgi:hypothetical protein